MAADLKPHELEGMTEAELSRAIDHAESEAERLRFRADAIADAKREARNAVLLNHYREAANDGSIACNQERSAVEQRLNEIATAEVLDVASLQAAFIDYKLADARCGGTALFSARLDAADPLPQNAIGVSQQRRTRTMRMLGDLSWSRYLDTVINERADREQSRYQDMLEANSYLAADKAEQRAGRQAAALADGEVLEVEVPTPIAQKYHQLISEIDEDSFDEERVRAAGIHTVRNMARNAELDRLVAEGN